MSDKTNQTNSAPRSQQKKTFFALRLFSKCINGLWAVLAFSLIALAIIIAALRLFTDEFSKFKPDLENYLSQQLGRNVNIKELKFEWPSVGPRIQLKQLEIEASEKAKLNSLVIANGVIVVDLWRSFFSMELITDEINLQGIQIQYNPSYRNDNTTLNDTRSIETKSTSLKSAEAQQKIRSQGSSRKIINWLLKQRTIEIYDSFLLLKTKTEKQFSLALPVLTFHGGTRHHQLNGTAVTANGKQLTIKSELKGESDDPLRQLQLYVKADDIDLKDLPTSLFVKKYTKIAGSLAIEIWADFTASHMQKMLIKASANKLLAGEKKLSFSIPESFFLWERNADNGWQFISTPISILLNNKNLPPFVLKGNRLEKKNRKEKTWSVQGLTLPVKLVSGILQDQLSPKLKNWLGKAKPEGLLANIGTTMKFSNNKLDFNLHFDLINFSIKQIGQYPGANNIDGHIKITDKKSTFSIDSKNGELNLKPLFRFPLPFKHLSTTIEFEYGDNSRLIWDNFNFQSKNVDIYSLGKIEYFKDGGGYLEISTQLQNGNAKFTPHFLPVGVMSKNGVRYLDNSIRSGALVKANAIVRGNFDNYPYINGDGIFDVQAKIKNVDFKFLESWPPLKELTASLRFHADSMDIFATHGNIEGIKIKKTTARIPQLSKVDNNLLLDIHAQTNGSDALRFLSRTSLKNIAEQLDFLKFSNKSSGTDLSTSLYMDIPLKGNKPAQIDGDIVFVDSDVSIKTPYIPFKKLNGKIKLSERGLIGGKLQGQLWQQPFKLTLKSKTTPFDSIVGEFKSKISTTGINQLSGLSFNDYISGEATINGKLRIDSPHKNIPRKIVIDIQSNLQNMDIHFPDGLSKAPLEKTPFKLSINILEDHTLIESFFGHSVTFSAEKYKSNPLLIKSLAFDPSPAKTKRINTEPAEYLWKSNLVINTTENSITPLTDDKSIFNANIQLQTLNIDSWMPLFNQVVSATDLSDSKTNSRVKINLNASTLSIFGLDLGAMQFDIEKNKDFAINFIGDKATGNIIFPAQTKRPIEINFKKLHITQQKDTTTEKEQLTRTAIPLSSKQKSEEKILNKTDQLVNKWQASDFPALKIHCDSCQYNQQLLGSIDLETIPSIKSTNQSDNNWTAIKGRWYFKKLFQIKFSGLWQNHQTRIQGDVNSDNFDKLNEFWDLSSGVKKSKLTASFLFRWPNAPWDFNMSQLDGEITTNLSSGYIEEISAQGAQVFSLFSLQNLKRRLTLDFKDVFEKGFFYDDISGTFLLKKGVAYSQNLKINGTAAAISITGSTNLNTGMYNQHMVVTPKLSSSLPVLAGWAISPQTALLALVFDKLFLKPALDVVSRIDYQITGSWDAPKLIELGKKKKEIQVEVKEKPSSD